MVLILFYYCKALGTKELKELYDYAIHLGLEVLVEIHDKEDLTKALKCGANIIGIIEIIEILIHLKWI